MKSPKKRSLNELRQTKDSYYVVPKAKSNTSLKNLLEEYFASKNESLNAKTLIILLITCVQMAINSELQGVEKYRK